MPSVLRRQSLQAQSYRFGLGNPHLSEGIKCLMPVDPGRAWPSCLEHGLRDAVKNHSFLVKLADLTGQPEGILVIPECLVMATLLVLRRGYPP